MIWKRQLVSDAIADWVIHRFEWLITTLGPRNFFENTRLILPTRSFIDAPSGTDEYAAGAVFDAVRQHMGIDHWPVKLVARPTARALYRRDIHAHSAIAGTFYQSDENEAAVITYDPLLMRTPKAFIGTMAHELAHYILAPYAQSAPGGEEEHELLTDLTVIFTGFGLIDIQGARDMGWKGYLSSDTRAYALATFLRLKELDPAMTQPFLDNYLRKRLRRALKQRDERSHELTLLSGLRAP